MRKKHCWPVLPPFARAKRKWRQQDLAEQLEVSRQSVNAIETGKYDLSLPLAFRIAEVFDLPIEQIVLRKETPSITRLA